MLGSIRRHSTWLWGLIIAAMAVSLLVVFNPAHPDSRGGSGGTSLGTLFGKNITVDDLARAEREFMLQVFTQQGDWPDTARYRDEITREGYKRLFMVRKQESMGIHISDNDVTRLAAMNIPRILQKLKMPQDPSMSSTKLFEAILKQHGLGLDDFDRFLRHELGEQQLVAALGMSGRLVTEAEARVMYDRDNQEYHAEAAFFIASNFLSEVTVTPAALSQFYSNHISTYQIPERIQVSYVAFDSTNYWAEAGRDLDRFTNATVAAEIATKYSLPANFATIPDLAKLLDAQYQQRSNSFAGVTPEKAKETIKSEIQHTLAMGKAGLLAGQFASPLLVNDVKVQALVDAATKAGLPLKVSSAFDESTGPAEISPTPNFAKIAFGLNDAEPIIGPISAENAVVVIGMNKKLPAEMPPIEAVKERVESDYKLFNSMMASRVAASKFAMNFTNGIPAGKTFSGLCADAKGKVALLPVFSMVTRSLPEVEAQMSLEQFMQIAASTPVNSVSSPMPTAQGAMVLHVQNRLPVDEKKAVAELPEFLQTMRNARQIEAFQQWFAMEASRELGGLPFFRQQAEMNNRRN